MNIAELAKKRKEEQALAEQTAEANKLIAEAKQQAPGSVSAGMMGSTEVHRDMEGPGTQPSADVEHDDRADHTVDPTKGGPQDAVAGILAGQGVDSSTLAPGIGVDPGTREKFVMPNPLLVREVTPEPEKKQGPSGSFRALRLQRFFDNEGNKIVPNEDGFYIPKNDWELYELQRFAEQYGLVEYQE